MGTWWDCLLIHQAPLVWCSPFGLQVILESQVFRPLMEVRRVGTNFALGYKMFLKAGATSEKAFNRNSLTNRALQHASSEGIGSLGQSQWCEMVCQVTWTSAMHGFKDSNQHLSCIKKQTCSQCSWWSFNVTWVILGSPRTSHDVTRYISWSFWILFKGSTM